MQAEQCGDEKARPERPGHPREHDKDEQRVGRVQQDARRVMAGGSEPEEADVELVRDPGQRMPVRGIERRQRPANVLQRQAGVDVAVVDDIVEVVEVGEGIGEGASVDDPNRRNDERGKDGV